MTKKITIILVSLVVLLAIGVGVYLSLGKKPPVSPQAPATQQTYTNPVFGFSLKFPTTYGTRTQTIKDIDPARKSSSMCVLEKSSDFCLIFIDVYQNISQLPSKAVLIQNLIGQYPGITWEKDTQTHYMITNEKTILHIYFDTKNNQIAKKILDTLKL